MLATIASWLLDPSGLTAHGFCLLWEPGLIWLHAMSDMAIGCAYFTIPLALGIFARRRTDMVFRPVFWLFAAFILLCGSTHWLGIVTLWLPAYWLEGSVKAATGIVSVLTAIVLWRLLPQALALPSPAQLQAVNVALAESEARYRASFERSPVPTHTLDMAGRITGVSDSWLLLLGYARDEVLGRPVTDFQPTDTPGWSLGAAADLLRLGELSELERRFCKRDGTIIDALVSARSERDSKAVWAICVVIDVTARRRAEEALRVSEERLHQAQKMEAVGQLTGGVAHDFNNMLQAISGGLELIDRRLDNGEADRVADYLPPVRRSVERASALTQRLLAFSRRQSLKPQPTAPDMLVLGLQDLIQRTIGPDIALELQLDAGRWQALCDPNQLESALINLAINARDAMPQGGILRIATADRHLTPSDLGDAELVQGDFVEITVIDNGTGMPPEVLSRAFEPFFTTKPTGHGTGLGLSQLYGFARQSGGSVQLESGVGRGTTVRLLLPRFAGETQVVVERHPRPRSASPVATTEAGRILLVEDETVVRGQMAEVLRELGFAVIEAQDGIAGLEIVQSDVELDLLVTDVGLPGVNGRQLAEAARERRPGLPVVLLTGYAGTKPHEDVLAPGMEVIQKPFALDELSDRVRSVFRTASTV